ncbi:hypothetical protein FHR71_005658 [Methylobacterium sp. RAS18]|nr:hypothetical protein [Methylobacterium sp. RAS18]
MVRPKPVTLSEMPGRIRAAKRLNVVKSDWMSGWYVGHGKDESCQVEGTANHWNWLALIILGLADPKDAPYDEDKPLPVTPAEIRIALDVIPAAREALKTVLASLRDPDADNLLPNAATEKVVAALAAMGERP